MEVVLDGAAKAVEYQMNEISGAARDAVEYYCLGSSLPTASHVLDDASERNRSALLADAETLITNSGEGSTPYAERSPTKMVRELSARQVGFAN